MEVAGLGVHFVYRHLDAVDDAVVSGAGHAGVDADYAGVGRLSLPEHRVEEQEGAHGEYSGQGHRDYYFECVESK